MNVSISYAFPIFVQALWRGHCSRRLTDNPKVVKLRHRLRLVSAEVREEDKLCNKTSSALEYLLQYKQFFDILEALKKLGTTWICVNCIKQSNAKHNNCFSKTI